MDELKKYLQQHTDKLDLDEPGPRVWENIRLETQQQPVVKKTNVVMMVTRWAAAACILVLAGIGGWHMWNEKDQQQDQSKITAAVPKTIAPVQKTIEPSQEPITEESSEAAETKTTLTPKHHKKTLPEPVTDKAGLAELQNIESSFTQVINLQRDRISNIPMYTETPEYFNDFKVQIRQMEKDEKVIKSDIAKRGMNEALLDQLINLYQQKLNTLKQLQIEMGKTNSRYKQHHGPVDSTKTYFLNL